MIKSVNAFRTKHENRLNEHVISNQGCCKYDSSMIGSNVENQKGWVSQIIDEN